MDLKGLAGKKGVWEEGVRGGEGHACIVGESTWDPSLPMSAFLHMSLCCRSCSGSTISPTCLSHIVQLELCVLLQLTYCMHTYLLMKRCTAQCQCTLSDSLWMHGICMAWHGCLEHSVTHTLDSR